jgi:signal transduction histidine kinase
MEVRSTPTSPGAQGPDIARYPIDQGELRSILSNLSHELCRPLVSLKAGFDLFLGESPRTITDDQRGHLLTMVSLCDDLLRLTHSYLDYAGIVQGSRPICLGSFTIGALIGEIEALDRVFEPFFRLSRDEHSVIDGSGLGLAICRELVTQLQGEISLSSVTGQGTSVSVRFPVASKRG